MARRLGNSSVSSLLKQAQAAYERQQSYNDSIAAYEWELSAKTEQDWNKYQAYLKERQGKTNDAAKKLEMEKKLTSTYRAFNSAEIQRASLAVNYGDINKTQKYNMMFGLLQRAYANGDFELAGNIESQMASLSVQIQNEANAAAGYGRGGGGRGQSGYSKIQQDLRDFENKVDRAYQTGQPLVVDGKNTPLDASSYAVYQAQILKSKYDLLSAQAQDDPKYADDLSKLQKSSEWRGLIDSGLVQFDENNNIQVSDGIKNLAVSFKKDQYGNTYRSFVAPELTADGKIQSGLAKNASDRGQQLYVALRQGTNTETNPELRQRVAYQVDQFKMDGKDQQGVGAYQDLISGNKLLVQTEGDNRGLRSTQYYDKTLGRQLTEQETLDNLKNLTKPAVYKPGPLDGIFDAVNNVTKAGDLPRFNPNNPFAQSALRFGATAAGAAAGFGGVGGILSNLFNRSQQEAYKRELEAKARAAEEARQRSIREAYARQQAAALQAAQRAATSAPRIVPVAPKSQVYLPTAYAKPADVFKSALGNNKSPQNVAKAIGKAVGYNF